MRGREKCVGGGGGNRKTNKRRQDVGRCSLTGSCIQLEGRRYLRLVGGDRWGDPLGSRVVNNDKQ